MCARPFPVSGGSAGEKVGVSRAPAGEKLGEKPG